MQENEELERRVIQLIATDRIEVPISSISGKLKKRKPKNNPSSIPLITSLV